MEILVCIQSAHRSRPSPLAGVGGAPQQPNKPLASSSASLSAVRVTFEAQNALSSPTTPFNEVAHIPHELYAALQYPSYIVVQSSRAVVTFRATPQHDGAGLVELQSGERLHSIFVTVAAFYQLFQGSEPTASLRYPQSTTSVVGTSAVELTHRAQMVAAAQTPLVAKSVLFGVEQPIGVNVPYQRLMQSYVAPFFLDHNRIIMHGEQFTLGGVEGTVRLITLKTDPAGTCVAIHDSTRITLLNAPSGAPKLNGHTPSIHPTQISSPPKALPSAEVVSIQKMKNELSGFPSPGEGMTPGGASASRRRWLKDEPVSNGFSPHVNRGGSSFRELSAHNSNGGSNWEPTPGSQTPIRNPYADGLSPNLTAYHPQETPAVAFVQPTPQDPVQGSRHAYVSAAPVTVAPVIVQAIPVLDSTTPPPLVVANNTNWQAAAPTTSNNARKQVWTVAPPAPSHEFQASTNSSTLNFSASPPLGSTSAARQEYHTNTPQTSVIHDTSPVVPNRGDSNSQPSGFQSHSAPRVGQSSPNVSRVRLDQGHERTVWERRWEEMEQWWEHKQKEFGLFAGAQNPPIATHSYSTWTHSGILRSEHYILSSIQAFRDCTKTLIAAHNDLREAILSTDPGIYRSHGVYSTGSSTSPLLSSEAQLQFSVKATAACRNLLLLFIGAPLELPLEVVQQFVERRGIQVQMMYRAKATGTIYVAHRPPSRSEVIKLASEGEVKLPLTPTEAAEFRFHYGQAEVPQEIRCEVVAPHHSMIDDLSRVREYEIGNWWLWYKHLNSLVQGTTGVSALGLKSGYRSSTAGTGELVVDHQAKERFHLLEERLESLRRFYSELRHASLEGSPSRQRSEPRGTFSPLADAQRTEEDMARLLDALEASRRTRVASSGDSNSEEIRQGITSAVIQQLEALAQDISAELSGTSEQRTREESSDLSVPPLLLRTVKMYFRVTLQIVHFYFDVLHSPLIGGLALNCSPTPPRQLAAYLEAERRAATKSSIQSMTPSQILLSLRGGELNLEDTPSWRDGPQQANAFASHIGEDEQFALEALRREATVLFPFFPSLTDNEVTGEGSTSALGAPLQGRDQGTPSRFRTSDEIYDPDPDDPMVISTVQLPSVLW
jgi:hypothetical protein